jgi:hypothetical protein
VKITKRRISDTAIKPRQYKYFVYSPLLPETSVEQRTRGKNG